MTNTIDLHTFLRTRRSIRRFKPDPIPDSVIREILHTATLAPSAHNRQPWRFVVMTDKTSIAEFAKMMAIEFRHVLEQDQLPPEEIQKRLNRSQERISGAPVVIIACVEMTEMEKYPDERRKKAEYLIATQSVANAGMQLLLAAH
ncbi:MAG TPA: nitroreductase family protein, partial [Anaerolineales bacterium]|nr:nitroreductase family protein [Anaerolineales bacterium]